MSSKRAPTAARKKSPARRAKSGRSRAVEPAVNFTSVDRVMFPDAGYTKGDLLEFYAGVSEKLLPHLLDRPVTLERDPDGVSAGTPSFWQKNTPEYYPDWIERVDLPSERRTVRYALVNDLRSLLYIANQNAVTFHVGFSRVKSLSKPDFVLFDLDPGERPFSDAVKVAKQVRKRLAEEKVEPLVKTSGKSGLHILTPWKRKGGFEEVRDWAFAVMQRVERDLPELATTERMKAARKGRLYLDVMQNAEGKHAVPPYVVRATPRATVSTPLDWDELTARLSPAKFDLKTALKRFAKQKRDPFASLLA
jgi:bifunctional non-homologous end joining protein LigD